MCIQCVFFVLLPTTISFNCFIHVSVIIDDALINQFNTSHRYNFHLFPRDELNIGMPSYSFSCQTSCLTSMAQEGFDFNVCIYDGEPLFGGR